MPARRTVLFATAELAPFARVGGLAAAAAGLVAELRRHDVAVELVVPDYFGPVLHGERVSELDVPLWARPATARRGVLDGVGEITLVDVPGIRRSHPYNAPDGSGWFDNDRRFFAFCTAVAAIADASRPDILHLNDWHTAVVPAYVSVPPPTVLTIHTLGYQGQTNSGWLNGFPHWPERYFFHGDCNPLVGGIRCADLVITVSPNYAREITTAEHGFGADGVLREKGDRLVGILNGIDTAEWDPQTDTHLPANYGPADLAPKAQSRRQVLAEFGLADTNGPLLVMVSRLVAQKGVDLLMPLVPYLGGIDAKLAVLGSGDWQLVDQLAHLSTVHSADVGFAARYDESLAHRLFAGGDVFVMPSRFEPCGLAQMQALRYGTLPLVTDVGGLHDTVIDIDADTKQGTGVVVPEASTTALLDGLHRAARAHGQVRRRTAMQRRGMAIDWSWAAPAQAHLDWYDRLVAERV